MGKHDRMAGFGFANEERVSGEITARDVKGVIADQLDALMRQQKIDRAELARRMKTSRAELDRLLNPASESVTLGTLARAAQTVGRQLRVELL